MKYEIIKGSEKDFEGAPEWATLRTFTGGSYFFAEFHDAGARVLDIARNDEFKSECDPTGVDIIAERRPITEALIEFDNDGFPLPGMECEAKYRDAANAEWVAFRCVGVDCGVAFGWAGKEAVTLGKGSYEFRPIRSPEDVARDEAKGIIAELCRSSASNGHSADLIYDAIAAGKIPGITLTAKSVKQLDSECEHKNTHPTSGGCACNDCGWTSW